MNHRSVQLFCEHHANRRALLLKYFRKEIFCAGALRIGEELFGCVLLNYFALVHEHELRADFAGEAHLMGDDDHRHALAGELLHQVENLAYHLGVEGARWLIEEDNLGVHRERADYCDSLLLAAGEG